MLIPKPFSKCANDESSIFLKFSLLFVIGIFTILAGVIILVVATMLSDGSTNFGTVIFIGPFPIVVGAGREAPWMVLFSIVLAVLSIIMFLVLRRRVKRTDI